MCIGQTELALKVSLSGHLSVLASYQFHTTDRLPAVVILPTHRCLPAAEVDHGQPPGLGTVLENLPKNDIDRTQLSRVFLEKGIEITATTYLYYYCRCFDHRNGCAACIFLELLKLMSGN